MALEQRRLGLEVVGVVGGQHLDVVQAEPGWWGSGPGPPPGGTQAPAARTTATAAAATTATEGVLQMNPRRRIPGSLSQKPTLCGLERRRANVRCPCKATVLMGILPRMPRAIWSGAISFGLVNIPIKLYAAVSRKTSTSTSSTPARGARIKYKKVSAADGEEVPSEAIVKGYELARGDYVTVGDDELASLDPEASRTIDIEEFVDLVDIDPLFYDSAYYVAPDKATTQALRPARPGDGGAGQGGDRPVRDALEAVPVPCSGRRTACWCCRRWSTPTR